jgi:hypothetical protein
MPYPQQINALICHTDLSVGILSSLQLDNYRLSSHKGKQLSIRQIRLYGLQNETCNRWLKSPVEDWIEILSAGRLKVIIIG